MFVAVIVGNIIAALLGFCGIIKIVLFCGDGWQGMDIAVFLEKLMLAVGPLVVGSIVFLLVQVAVLLEKLIFLTKYAPGAGVAPKQNPTRAFGATAGNMGQAANASAPQPHTVEGHGRAPVPRSAYSAAQSARQTPMGSTATGRMDAVAAPRGGIQPGTFFHMEPTAIPAVQTAPAPIPTVPHDIDPSILQPTQPQNAMVPTPAPTPDPQPEGQQDGKPGAQQPTPPPAEGLSFFRLD